jgi:DNA-binding transcriptional MerR regulator
MMCDFEDKSTVENKGAIHLDDRSELPIAQDTLLSIGNVSRMFKVSRVALRACEWLGLIRRRNRVGRVRVYSWTDCDRVAFIVKARRAGLPVRRIAPILRGLELSASDAAVKHARMKCFELIDQLDRRRQTLREALAELRHLDKLLAKNLPAAETGVSARDNDDE